MSTSAVIRVLDFDLSLITTIFCKYDGYEEGIGKKIKTHLNHGHAKIVNGITPAMFSPLHFNGMGCLAAYLVGALKNFELGNVYLLGEHARPFVDFVYFLRPTKSQEQYWELSVDVFDVKAKNYIYSGFLEEYSHV